MMSLKKIITELFIRMYPLKSTLKTKLLAIKFLDVVRFRGNNSNMIHYTRILRRNGLVLGKNVVIEGGGTFDATSGISLGDNVTVKKGVNILSYNEDGYNPVIIGAGNTIEEDINPGTIISNKCRVNGLSDYKGQIVFIVSTGRSGSNAIANLIDQHPDAVCYHDSFPHIYTYASDKLYIREGTETIINRLNALYNSCDMSKGIVHGQSDQKLSALIPELAALFPTAKFLWLIRKADSFVNSSYPRGWFADSEFGYGEHNPKEFFPKQATPSKFDAAHRLNGYKIGVFAENQWKSMTAFERNCWYWSYWNSMIDNHLSQLNPERSMMVRLDQLSNSINQILDFVGLERMDLKSEKTNKAKYKTLKTENWTDEMKKIYLNQCNENMEKWFDK